MYLHDWPKRSRRFSLAASQRCLIIWLLIPSLPVTVFVFESSRFHIIELCFGEICCHEGGGIMSVVLGETASLA